MPELTTTDGTLFYTDQGSGRPVVFIHGWSMTSRFFERQRADVARRYRFIAPDLRSHGRSETVPHSNTVPAQTQDLAELFTALDLQDMVLVGWSSGAFNVWEYLDRHGDERVAGVVIVDESPCPLKRSDWDHGYFDLDGLVSWFQAVQTDLPAMIRDQFLRAAFVAPPRPEDADWMIRETTMISPTIAAAAGFDQCTRDYRPFLPNVKVPALVCFGRHDMFVPAPNAEFLTHSMPEARLVVFEDSGHVPFWEEPERFNTELDAFIRSIHR